MMGNWIHLHVRLGRKSQNNVIKDKEETNKNVPNSSSVRGWAHTRIGDRQDMVVVSLNQQWWSRGDRELQGWEAGGA